jgi:hypothetical protein
MRALSHFFIFAFFLYLVSGANQSITPKSNVPISQQQGTNDSNVMEIESDFSIVESKNDLNGLIQNAIGICQRAKNIYERHDPTRKFLPAFLESQKKDFNLECEFSFFPNGSENQELMDEMVRIGKLTEFYLKIAYHVMDQWKKSAVSK